MSTHGLKEHVTSDEDFSGEFGAVRRTVSDSRGVRLADFVRGLTPVYPRIYRGLAFGFAGLGLSVALAIMADRQGVAPLAIAVVGGLVIGFWFFYLVSFVHEGLHWNLTPTRRSNDQLTGAMIACMLGLSLEARRRQHFEHHRSLGTTRDTEMMYFYPLNLIALLKSATGFGALRALAAYVRRATRRAAATKQTAPTSADPGIYKAVAIGVATHGSIVAVLLLFGTTATAVAWVLAVFSVMPILNTIRQLLEHRHPRARLDVDYRTVDQGACTRMFSDGWLDRAFGPAGGHQHLLHHWEGQVSYTRLADLERFLLDTPLRPVIDRRRTTYARALANLFTLT